MLATWAAFSSCACVCGEKLMGLLPEVMSFFFLRAGLLEKLKRRGHRIVTVDDYNQFGCGQMIWKLDGGYFTASDPRRDGQAVGF